MVGLDFRPVVFSLDCIALSWLRLEIASYLVYKSNKEESKQATRPKKDKKNNGKESSLNLTKT